MKSAALLAVAAIITNSKMPWINPDFRAQKFYWGVAGQKPRTKKGKKK